MVQHRFHGLRGQAYVREYKRLLEELRSPIKKEFDSIVKAQGKFTPIDLGVIANKFQLPVTVTDEFLADIVSRYPSGTWQRLQDRGCRAKNIGVEWK